MPHEVSSFMKTYSYKNQIKNSYDEIVHPCPRSKYFSGLVTREHFQTNSGYCVGIDFQSFSVAVKSWRCQVEINLVMPAYMIAIGKKTKIFTRSGWFMSINIVQLIPNDFYTISIHLGEKSVYRYDTQLINYWLDTYTVTFMSDT